DPLGRRDPAFVRLADAPRALAFSPSGHRIYVARRNVPGLAVVDRYERKELDGVALPGTVATLRLDPLGRWLLARPAIGDSAWLVDLPIKRHTGIVPTQWHADLPPQHPDDGYRVVLGPYATREQAEATGRRLGRPFWIYQPGQ